MSFPPSLGITSAFIVDLGSSLDFQDSPFLLFPSLDCLHSPFPRAKMNGYSRIKKLNTTRSKSVDFADLSFPHLTPRSKKLHSKSTSHKNKPDHTTKNIPAMHDPIPEHEQDDGPGEAFGIILSRKFPISSSSTHSCKEKDEQENPSFHTAVKKSLSIKRSSSISEGYSRIHHQSDFIAEDDVHHAAETTSQKTCAKKKGKFLKACRRLFGF